MTNAIIKNLRPLTPDSPVASYLNRRHLGWVTQEKSTAINLGWDNLNYFCNQTKQFYRLPTIVAPFTKNGEVVAIHRTFIDENREIIARGHDRRFKGKMSGSVAKLLKGSSNRVILTEGIEDALSLWSVDNCNLETHVWVAGSSTNLKTINLPRWKSLKLIIGADNDAAGIAAANHLQKRVADIEGYSAVVLPPLSGKDWNQYICMIRGVS